MTHDFRDRSRILVIDSVIPEALGAALEQNGLALVHSSSDAGNDVLDDVLGCAVWFYEGMRSPWRVWRLAHRLRRHGIPLFAWNRDAPHYLNRAPWRLNWYDQARLLDVYATHSMADSRHFADSWLYLPNAADTGNYNLSGIALDALRNGARYRYDVSFFGAMNGSRYKEMREREEFFSALGERLLAKGICFLFRESEGMTIGNQVELIHNSRINLNFGASCEYEAPFASGLPERCYGIPASGGFLLCDKRSHARSDFTPGENWAEFDGINDCVAKIDFWMANFELARGLAERCHAHVMESHTYANRAQTLRNALLAWWNGKRGLLG
jgi:spore maturation protein CgeB